MFLVFPQFRLISSRYLRARDFNVAAVRLPATSPFSSNMDWPVIFCRLSEYFRLVLRCTEPDRRAPAAKIKHDLRRARLAGIQRDRADLVETHIGWHRSRLRRRLDRKSTRLNSSHVSISYAVF